MKKIVIALVFLLSLDSVFSMDLSVGFNLGISKPLGMFADNSSIYSKCNSGYNPFHDFTISNSSMNTPFMGEIYLTVKASDFISFNLGLERIYYTIDGIKFIVGDPMISQQTDRTSASPWFKETNLKLGINFKVLTIDKFTILLGLEPQLCFISYNSIAFVYSTPYPYYISNDNSTQPFGLTGKISLQYIIDKKIKLNLNGAYSHIFMDYNNDALSLAYMCFPTENYYSNPNQLIVSLGLSYLLMN